MCKKSMLVKEPETNEQDVRTLIMKFGGASLSEPAQFDMIADLILKKTTEFARIVTVVSAMGKTTDDLISLAKNVNPNPPQREYDMLLSVGERISMSLLAMAIAKKKAHAISFTGSQSGIITSSRHTDAKIIDVKPYRILENLKKNTIVIVAGFQGVSRQGEITTLGRGGSDTTAVALGAALQAEKVEFYKDVPGIFSEDPKYSSAAALYSTITYDEALSITAKGKILHSRSVALAKINHLPLHVLSFKEEYQHFSGTIIQSSEQKTTNTAIFELDEHI